LALSTLKAFIDGIVQRFAKSLSITGTLGHDGWRERRAAALAAGEKTETAQR
jgi:hypothetical protein